MKYDLEKLRRIALELENDSNFHAAYTRIKAHNGSRRECINANSIGLLKAEREQLRRYFDRHWNLPSMVGPDTDGVMAALPTIDIHTDNTPEPVVTPVDYSTLPDGTRFKLVNDFVVTKGIYDGPLRHVKPQHGRRGQFDVWLQTAADTVGFATLDASGTDLHNPGWSIVEVLPPEIQPDHLVTTTEENLMDAIIEITTKTLVNGKDVADMKDSEVYALIAAQEAKVKELEAITTKPKRLVAELAKRQAGIQALVDYLDSKEPASA